MSPRKGAPDDRAFAMPLVVIKDLLAARPDICNELEQRPKINRVATRASALVSRCRRGPYGMRRDAGRRHRRRALDHAATTAASNRNAAGSGSWRRTP